MRSAFRHGAIMVALAATIGVLAVHQWGPGLAVTDAAIGPTFPDDETTGSVDRSARAGWIQLSDEQRGWVFLGVMNLPDVPEANVPAPEPAAALAHSIELRDPSGARYS